jgi:hypothetical protein
MNAIQLAPPSDSYDEVFDEDLELADADSSDSLGALEDIESDGGDSGPVAIALDEAWLDETWDSLDAGDPPIRFDVEGDRLAVHSARRTRGTLTEAQGIVKRLEEDRIVLGTPGLSTDVATVRYRLPASLDLRALIGRRVRITVVEEPGPGLRRAQTITIRTADDRVWLVARSGPVRAVAYTLAGSVVRVSFSPTEGGPLVVSPPDARHIVGAGSEVRLRFGAARFVLELVSRDPAGCGTYFIASDLLWH